MEIALANGPFLALHVGAGLHRVVLRYAPPGMRTGAAVSSAALVGLIASGVFARRRARARSGRGNDVAAGSAA